MNGMSGLQQVSDSQDKAAVAHVLRRMAFGPRPGQVDRRGGAGAVALVEELLAAPAVALVEPQLGTDDDKAAMVKWWVKRMSADDAGLVERITWFWHTHLTSSFEKVEQARMMLGQHRLLYNNALGNFRELLQSITIDPAMLLYLDGAWSEGGAPNENYAREAMELFALGRGVYTEADVKAGARALAGWTVSDDGKASFDSTRAYDKDVTFLGKTGRLDTRTVIDTICDHPACAPHVVSKLYAHLIGTELTDARRDELAEIFRDSGLEIRPVVQNIVRHPEFLGTPARYARVRGPVEWRNAASAVLGINIDWNELWSMGQVPFWPPNVAGWPDQRRWLNAGVALQRAHIAHDSAWDSLAVDADDHAAWALERAGIYDASPATIDAITVAVARVEGRREKCTVALSLVVNATEFVLC